MVELSIKATDTIEIQNSVKHKLDIMMFFEQRGLILHFLDNESNCKFSIVFSVASFDRSIKTFSPCE